MAIRTTGSGAALRVLTKNEGGVRRVSCSCCEEGEGCCMYTAQAFFDGLYTENDLPDSLMLNPFDLGSISVEIQRNGLIYGPHEFFSGYSQQIRLVSNTFLNEGPRWVLEQIGIEEHLDDNPCLFVEGNLVGEYGGGAGGITDLFEDTYQVQAFDDIGDLFVTDLYVRESLCRWAILDSESSLVFSPPISGSFPFGWLAAIFEFNGKKDGNQNDPVGEYPVTEGLFTGGKLVVSIP